MMTETTWPAAWGLLLGLSLCLSIGPANLFILRQGVEGRHVLAACGVAACGDATLVALGIVGLGPLLLGFPMVTRAAALVAALFIGWMGVEALRRGLSPAGGPGPGRPSAGALPLGRVVATALALSLLNPQAHAELILLVGSSAAIYGHDGRVEFGMGVAAASFLWLFLLGFAALRLQPVLLRPGIARCLDLATAALMLALALNMVVNRFG